MRTKKLLSVLFAILLAIGVFGVIPAGAIIDDEAADKLAAQAVAGYPSDGIGIYTDSSLLGRWDSTVAIWEVFTRSATNVQDGYNDLKGAKPTALAGVEWTATGYQKDETKDANGKTIWVENRNKPFNMPVRENETQAQYRDYQFYKGSTQTQERLYLKQGTVPYYGTVTIKLTLWVDGKTPNLEVEKDITLLDQSGVEDLLKDAQKILDKTDRYTKDYLNVLTNRRGILRNCLSADPTLPSFEQDVADAKAALQAQMAASESNYKLTGIAFIDNILPQGLMKAIWGIIDFVNTAIEFIGAISGIFGPIWNLITSIGKIIGAILPIFAGLGGLIALPF